MKNKRNKKNVLLWKTFCNFLIKIIIWSILLYIIFYLLHIFVDNKDFLWLMYKSRSTYFYLAGLYNDIVSGRNYLFPFIIWIIGVLVIIFRMLKKYDIFINQLTEAASNLSNKDIEYIYLPSELSEFEFKLNHLKRESEKNERLARESEQRKNDLIVYLAHDLKTPLTSMIGYLSLLDEIKDMPKKQREKYVKVALDKSYRLEELINELFDIARFNSETIVLEKEEINLTLLLEQIIDDFYPILNENEKKIKLNYSDKVIINGDSDKMARVFGNLIKNAINYSTDGLITIDVNKNDNFVTIIVSNKGKKISEEKLNKIFEKFYRADSSRTSKTGGSGLGLAIAKEIIELHNGSINATSDDKFTKFYVELPIKK